MRLRTLRSIAALAIFGSLAACSHDSPTGPGSLSSAEAPLVAVNLFEQMFGALASATPTADGLSASRSLSAAPTIIHYTFNGACAAGGTVQGTEAITQTLDQSGNGTESDSVTVTSVGCKVSTGSRTIAVDGSFTLTYSVAVTNNSVSNFTWRMDGNFTWLGGSCAIDYSVVQGQGHVSVTGSICGQTISYSD